MQNKILYTILALLVLAMVGLYIYGKSQNQPPIVSTARNSETAPSVLKQGDSTSANSNASVSNSSTNSNTDTPASSANNSSQGQYSDEADIQNPDVAVQEVVFDGTKFSPSTLTIKKGDIVIFKNDSSGNFWPASGPHPQHTNYPEFDAKSALGSGKTFQFKFTKTGSWSYHDHLKPTATGTIKVTE